MKILITGSNGFIGKHLSNELAKSGHCPIPLKSNLLDQKSLAQELRESEFDQVVHLAGLSHQLNHKAEDFYFNNVIGSQNLISGIEQFFKNKKIFIASTGHVYSNSSLQVSENHKLQPEGHYATSKLAMEYICKTSAMTSDVVILRLFNCTGIGQDNSFFIPKLINSFKKKLPTLKLGNLNVEREFNDIRWVTYVLRSLIEIDTPTEIFNICTGKTYNLEVIIKKIENMTGHFPSLEMESKFIRQKERKVLKGDPSKLYSFLKKHGKFVNFIPLEQTLSLMLSNDYDHLLSSGA